MRQLCSNALHQIVMLVGGYLIDADEKQEEALVYFMGEVGGAEYSAANALGVASSASRLLPAR